MDYDTVSNDFPLKLDDTFKLDGKRYRVIESVDFDACLGCTAKVEDEYDEVLCESLPDVCYSGFMFMEVK